MDWTRVINRNRDALLRMLAMIFAMAGVAGDGSQDDDTLRMSRHLHAAVVRILRPAESAFRRLLVVVMAVKAITAAAQNRPAAYSDTDTGSDMTKGFGPLPRGERRDVPCFALFDRRKNFEPHVRRFARYQPRIWEPGMDDPVFDTVTASSPDDLVNATALLRRLNALKHALDDVPGQARRMARWLAKRETARAQTGKYIRPMRPGKPPGHRDRKRHPVDHLLADCHALALYVLHPPDT